MGFEVSLHIPDLNSVTPVRYIMEPEYVSQQELKQENTMQQVEDAKDTESWTVDQSDGTMYFFLDENNGWRLVITDAAAGSRFYVMEKTMDGGSTWECINDDPFSGQLGVAEGLIFYDENFGVAGITGASQSYSRLYVTRDGGRTFEEMKLPMDLVSELPQIAIDCGFTVEDFDLPVNLMLGCSMTVVTGNLEHCLRVIRDREGHLAKVRDQVVHQGNPREREEAERRN